MWIINTMPNLTDQEASALAADPTTAPAILLEILNHHQSRAICKLLASNPNIPSSALLYLAQKFPREVVENPIFMLMSLENPAFISEMHESTLVAILKRKNAPSEFIKGAMNHPSYLVTTALLKQQNLPEDDLAQLIDRIQSRDMAKLFAEHPNCTEQLKYKIAKSGQPHLQMALANQCLAMSILPNSLLKCLIDQAGLDLQERLALDLKMPNGLLDRLFGPDRYPLQYHLAQRFSRDHTWMNSWMPEHIQLRLAQNQIRDIDRRIQVRQLLAESSLISLPIIDVLSHDPYARVRAALAKRSNMTDDQFLQFAQDQSNTVHNGLLENAAIDADRLTRMAENQHPRVRTFIAQHPQTPSSILTTFADDPLLRPHIARHLNTPTNLLRTLAADGDCDIALTQNPNIADSIVQPILAKLAIDPSYTVRKLVARHPQTPQAILIQLAQDPEPKVQHLAQERLVR
jgi:Leucine rich repeat variant